MNKEEIKIFKDRYGVKRDYIWCLDHHNEPYQMDLRDLDLNFRYFDEVLEWWITKEDVLNYLKENRRDDD